MSQVRKGGRLVIPCVRPDADVTVFWRKSGPGGRGGEGVGRDKVDGETGAVVIEELGEEDEGNYTCLVQIVKGERRVLQTNVRIVPNIVTSINNKIWVKEGDNVTLKCNVLPGRDHPILLFVGMPHLLYYV